jgi:hypothetical protein
MQSACSNCKREIGIDNKGRFCQWCGWDLLRNPSDQILENIQGVLESKAKKKNGHVDANYSTYSEYYQKRFISFDRHGGRFEATWNWASFFFGPIWYFLRMMPVKAILICLAIMFSSGILILPLCIYTGVAGNYDYYLSEIKKKRFW